MRIVVVEKAKREKEGRKKWKKWSTQGENWDTERERVGRTRIEK